MRIVCFDPCNFLFYIYHRADQIFLADPRQKFMSVLGREGVTPDYLLYGKITTLSTAGTNEFANAGTVGT